MVAVPQAGRVLRGGCGDGRERQQRYGGRAGAFFFPPGSAPLVHNETYVMAATHKLFHENDVFFVDTHVVTARMSRCGRRSGCG